MTFSHNSLKEFDFHFRQHHGLKTRLVDPHENVCSNNHLSSTTKETICSFTNESTLSTPVAELLSKSNSTHRSYTQLNQEIEYYINSEGLFNWDSVNLSDFFPEKDEKRINSIENFNESTEKVFTDISSREHLDSVNKIAERLSSLSQSIHRYYQTQISSLTSFRIKYQHLYRDMVTQPSDEIESIFQTILNSPASCDSEEEHNVDVYVSLGIIVTIFERMIGDAFYSFTQGKVSVPRILRELLMHSITQRVITPKISILISAIMGQPSGLNLRNLYWHGFMAPNEASPALLSLTMMLLLSTAERCQRFLQEHSDVRWNPRPLKGYESLDPSLWDFGLGVSPFRSLRHDNSHDLQGINYKCDDTINNNNNNNNNDNNDNNNNKIENNNFENNSFVNDIQNDLLLKQSSYFIIYNRYSVIQYAIEQFRSHRYLRCVCALMPQLEQCLRRVFVYMNATTIPEEVFSAAAEVYYTTMDVLLSNWTINPLNIPIATTYNQREMELFHTGEGNQMIQLIGNHSVEALADLLLVGLRIRDKCAHGECSALKMSRDASERVIGVFIGIALQFDIRNVDEEYFLENILPSSLSFCYQFICRRYINCFYPQSLLIREMSSLFRFNEDRLVSNIIERLDPSSLWYRNPSIPTQSQQSTKIEKENEKETLPWFTSIKEVSNYQCILTDQSISYSKRQHNHSSGESTIHEIKNLDQIKAELYSLLNSGNRNQNGQKQKKAGKNKNKAQVNLVGQDIFRFLVSLRREMIDVIDKWREADDEKMKDQDPKQSIQSNNKQIGSQIWSNSVVSLVHDRYLKDNDNSLQSFVARRQIQKTGYDAMRDVSHTWIQQFERKKSIRYSTLEMLRKIISRTFESLQEFVEKEENLENMIIHRKARTSHRKQFGIILQMSSCFSIIVDILLMFVEMHMHNVCTRRQIKDYPLVTYQSYQEKNNNTNDNYKNSNSVDIGDTEIHKLMKTTLFMCEKMKSSIIEGKIGEALHQMVLFLTSKSLDSRFVSPVTSDICHPHFSSSN